VAGQDGAGQGAGARPKGGAAAARSQAAPSAAQAAEAAAQASAASRSAAIAAISLCQRVIQSSARRSISVSSGVGRGPSIAHH
jgi:hypothetical protein